jgi:hypothetical protein
MPLDAKLLTTAQRASSLNFQAGTILVHASRAGLSVPLISLFGFFSERGHAQK